MAQEVSNNVINNYKGVMLCSRPNEKRTNDVDRPFCARVVPPDHLGYNPIKKEHSQNERPLNKKNTILDRHKKWLNEFKGTIQKTKEELEQKEKKQEEKFKKIRDQAQADRERAKKMKEEYNQTANNVLNILDEKVQGTGELTADNLRKLNEANEVSAKASQFKKKGKQKPVWAMTKQEVQENEQEEVDELLNFFETNNVQNYSEDNEIKQLLGHLKLKIQKMKQEDDWKQKEAQKIKRSKEERGDEGQEDDKYSHFSVQSEGKSVASQKTQKKIEQLRAKKQQQQQWDKHTTSQKSSAANIEDKIAKNIADQVLRNYPNMKGVHSNTSIRRLLEAEAAKVMNEPIMRPVITTIVKEKQPINANNLPYLHRNPAI